MYVYIVCGVMEVGACLQWPRNQLKALWASLPITEKGSWAIKGVHLTIHLMHPKNCHVIIMYLHLCIHAGTVMYECMHDYMCTCPVCA